MKVPVAHDFICPWCWVGLKQAQQLQKEFGVEIEWLGYELYPDELEYPQWGPAAEADPKRPKTPTRMELAWAAQGMEPPTALRPKGMRTHNAHEAVEYAKTEGVVRDIPALLEAIENRRFKDKIVGFDDPAYASGIYNVPTFIIEGERYAEQPYSVLKKAIGAVAGVPA